MRSARQERHVGGPGDSLRPILDQYGLAAISAWSDSRDTFHGNFSSSLIDYLFLPVALADRIRSSGTFYNAAKKLQLIRKRGIADHVPVHVVTMYLLQHPSHEADFPDERVTKKEVPKWD